MRVDTLGRKVPLRTKEWNAKISAAQDRKITLSCQQCGTLYRRSLCYKNTSRFCSLKCSYDAKRGKGIQKPIEWHNDNGCIRCTSHSIGSHGYVVAWRDGKLFTIPRLIIRKRGQLAKGIMALHSCDNRWCINPSHISAGTSSENIKQAWARTRRKA